MKSSQQAVNGVNDSPKATKTLLTFVLWLNSINVLSWGFWVVFFLIFLVHCMTWAIFGQNSWISAFGGVVTLLTLSKEVSEKATKSIQEELELPFKKINEGQYMFESEHGHQEITQDAATAERVNASHEGQVAKRHLKYLVLNLLIILGTLLWAYGFLLPAHEVCT